MRHIILLVHHRLIISASQALEGREDRDEWPERCGQGGVIYCGYLDIPNPLEEDDVLRDMKLHYRQGTRCRYVIQ